MFSLYQLYRFNLHAHNAPRANAHLDGNVYTCIHTCNHYSNQNIGLSKKAFGPWMAWLSGLNAGL